ncbi:hypothetical protein H5410_002401, partial [Solanum commersonii]
MIMLWEGKNGTSWKRLDNLFTGYYLEDSQVSEVSKDYRKGLTWMQISYLGRDSGHYLIMTNKGFYKMIQIMSEKRLSRIHITWWKGFIMLIMWL